MKQYDYIFAGGGLAGLSLAVHLANSPLRDASMLVVDRDAKQRNDRTWCFWTREPTLFDPIVYREWSRLQFVAENLSKEYALHDYCYKMIRGMDLYDFARKIFASKRLAKSNVEFVQGTVERIEEGKNHASVLVNGERVYGRWVFDSRFALSRFHPNSAHCHTLRQYFKGWLVETPHAMFDPACATLMDFRVSQENEMRFFYLLPLSPTRALVEFVTQSPARYDRELKNYLETSLRITDYRVLETEGGVNPMSDHAFARQASEHVMNIGTRGGRVKPSSGYAFMRIQHDSAAIVKSLEQCEHPFNVPADPAYYRLCDTLMLDVMQHHGDQIRPIFTALFKNNPLERILHFLDQAATPGENSKLVASLPPKLFLQALFRLSLSDTIAHSFGHS